MRNMNKKGFTIVELVVVVAVIAILAAVLIPTFSGIIRKANISSDTVVAKNLNTAAIAEDADTFDEAIDAVRDAGYYVANLNAKASDCYFVWEDESNQFILYDLKNREIIYSNAEIANEPDADWCFAVSNPTVANSVKATLSDITIKNTAATMDDLKATIAAGGEVTIYVDESVAMDTTNVIKIDDAAAKITIDLGSATVTGNNNGAPAIENIPFHVSKGSLTIKGGNISAAGTMLDADGELSEYAIVTEKGTYTKVENSTFTINTAQNGYLKFYGNADVTGATINSSDMGIGAYGGSTVNVEKTTINAAGHACFFVSNHTADEGKNTTLNVSSGTYKGGKVDAADSDYKSACLVAFSGNLVVTGGDFTSNTDNMFWVMTGTITLKGTATFNGKTLAQLGTAGLQAMCGNGTVFANGDGSYTIK